MADLYPIAIIEDRYAGVYSGGKWLAIAEHDDILPAGLGGASITRLAWISVGGPGGSDPEAREFWANPPAWIAAANTPDEALKALLDKHAPEGAGI